MLRLYRQQILPGLSFECAVPEGEGYGPGTWVVLQCERFQEVGRLQAPCPCAPAEDIAVWERQRSERGARRMEGAKIPLVLRKATEEDRQRRRENRELAQSMTPLVEEKLRECQLAHLRLTTLHLTLDRKYLVCLYTAQGRVDFRSFLHSMATVVSQRLEMRQIGPREEAAILGGLGICGRPLCCHGFLSLLLPPAQTPTPWRSSSKLGLCNQSRCCLRFTPEEPRKSPPSPPPPEEKTP